MRSLHADLLLQRLQQTTGGQLRLRVCQCLRTAIADGSIPPGSRLPATRDLARELEVSRNTVLYAYEQLQAEGYLQAKTGSGTAVAEILPDSYLTAVAGQSYHIERYAKEARLSKRGGTLMGYANASPHQWGAFVPGVPDVREFPHALFSSIQRKINRDPLHHHLTYSHQGGSYELQQALVEYLRVTRSVQCDVDQILITEGTHQGIDLIAKMLCDPGDRVWFEEPGYWGARNILRINGAELQPVPVDGQGLVPPAPEGAPPKLIFVTPSHQYPLGAVMSLPRRQQLLALAREQGSWIIEDDYDSEFRFSGQPYPALQGLEPDAPVIYLGTFSKTLYPALRIGYMVLPKPLASAMKLASAELYRGGHFLIQTALAQFMREGHYTAHIRRMRLLYGRRRAYLVSLIQRYLGPEFLHEYDHDAGLHLVLVLPKGCDDVKIAAHALRRGVKVRPLSQYFMCRQSRRGLLLGFACVEESAMLPAFNVLRDSLIKGGLTLPGGAPAQSGK
ncbi:PLP-dependent aminotransferase family protein [Nissabacter sp. SGAir0207]|uniref:MocR-like pyridoxine biosynthesis transcription factor PdxR n=1 Tax=Nissabacter sp. SGAir0207 TaxID=2126321 RepID=UPI0010CD2D7E|nr:PLP-dependent aminotransferase family protein [Nissabacter sp. SGAir0207]QCR37408.1 DNA-binding protein [Nissabacter sp. SGAir0207]